MLKCIVSIAACFSLPSVQEYGMGKFGGYHWSDVDFAKRIIHITGTIKYVKELGHYIETPKTQTSKRDIPMLEICQELLKAQEKNQTEQKELAGEWWKLLKGLENLVFTSTDRKPVSREKVTAELNKIIKKMQEEHIYIPQFTFHTLRHTFVTRGLELGFIFSRSSNHESQGNGKNGGGF